MKMYSSLIGFLQSLGNAEIPFDMISILPTQVLAKIFITLNETEKKIIYKEAISAGGKMAESFEESMTPDSLKDIKLQKKFTWEEGEFGQTFRLIGEKMGWGKSEVLNMSEKGFTKSFHENTIPSFVLKHYGKQKAPICCWMSGIISGCYGGLMKKKLEVKETKCIACADPYCEFEISVIK